LGCVGVYVPSEMLLELEVVDRWVNVPLAIEAI
jgi:hypothetical protein